MIIIPIQLALLLIAAWTDVTSRRISNQVCLGLAGLGAIGRLFLGPSELAISLGIAAALFLVLSLMHGRRWLGGGDVKLLVAIVIGLPAMHVGRLFMMIALAGGLLAGVHLLLRYLPRPRLAPAGSSFLRRIYAVERWRALRRAPLPYGVAIACGGFWAIFN